MRKVFKKAAVASAAAMMLGMVGSASVVSAESVPTKKYVIGIAEAQANDEVTTRRAYLENFIAPTYNVEFIFSETLKDDAAVKTFIENCIDSGADAIIDFKSASGQMARLCEENDVIYTINGSYAQSTEFMEEDFPLFTGCVGANNEQVGSLFGDWLEENASEDGSEGFLVASTMASQGNTQHIEICRAILEGLQQKYDITYEQSIEDIIASSETTNVANDKNIKITIYPGSPNKDTWLPGISSLIQTGEYGVVLSSGQTYNQSATVVNEVEQSFNKDIKIASVGALGTTLQTAFHTEDPLGNPSVDLITVKSVSCLTAALFAVTYNALTDGTEILRDADGKPLNYMFNFIGITSPEQLDSMANWDNKETNTWIANEKVVDSMLTFKSGATGQEISDFMKSLSTEKITELMGEQ